MDSLMALYSSSCLTN